jgi:hypothetical protein
MAIFPCINHQTTGELSTLLAVCMMGDGIFLAPFVHLDFFSQNVIPTQTFW